MLANYNLNEIFYSLQGEGHHSGTAMVFVRFSGCNLKCDFCDTLHHQKMSLTDDQIAEEVSNYNCETVCFTGGEPLLQLDVNLIKKIKEIGKIKKFHLETNGTINPPKEVLNLLDWITISPKNLDYPILTRFNELKIVYNGQDVSKYESFRALAILFLQPLWNARRPFENVSKAIAFIKSRPVWRLSIQTQKLIGIK